MQSSPLPSRTDEPSSRSSENSNSTEDATSFQRQSDQTTPTEKSLHLTFHSMGCLLDILVTLSRIGAKVVYLSAKENSAILSVTATPFVIRRVPSLLRELIEVLDLNEL